MRKAILFTPSQEAIDASLDARRYVSRLSRRLELETRRYDTNENIEVGDDVDSVAVLAALSSLQLESGYMEMELDTVFRPQELLGKLRGILPADFPIVAIVDPSGGFPNRRHRGRRLLQLPDECLSESRRLGGRGHKRRPVRPGHVPLQKPGPALSLHQFLPRGLGGPGGTLPA